MQVTSSQSEVTSYKYYDDGYLAQRQEGTSVVKYINDGMQCIAKYSGSGSLIEEYVCGANTDEVLCRITASGAWAYYHQDALQSVVAITDGNGTISASYQYDVFGKVRSQTGTLSNEILFTGRWLDALTGLYNYRARWYDPVTGRFLSRDPIGIRGGVNLYGYVEGNPISRTDPYGFKMNWGCFSRCSASCIIQHLKLIMELLLTPIEGSSPTPEPVDINEVFELGKCIKRCAELCQEKDDKCDKDNKNDYRGTPNVPAIIPHLPPMVI